MTHQLDVIDPTFVEDLDRSHEAVRLVAEFLTSRGHPVVLQPTWVRPDASVRGNYRDGGDLYLQQRIEVKRRTFDFTSRSDYPHPSATVDVCELFDQKRPVPHVYVICSYNMQHAAFVDVARSRKFWTTFAPKARGRVRELYLCPLDHISFARLRGKA